MRPEYDPVIIVFASGSIRAALIVVVVVVIIIVISAETNVDLIDANNVSTLIIWNALAMRTEALLVCEMENTSQSDLQYMRMMIQGNFQSIRSERIYRALLKR